MFIIFVVNVIFIWNVIRYEYKYICVYFSLCEYGMMIW